MKLGLSVLLQFLVVSIFAQCKDSVLIKPWGKWNELQFNSSIYRLEHHTSDSLLPANIRKVVKEALVNRCGENFCARLKVVDLSIVIPLRPKQNKDDLMAEGVVKGGDIKYYYCYEFFEKPNILYRFNIALDVQGKILTEWKLPIIKNNQYSKCISFCEAMNIAYNDTKSKINLINNAELLYEAKLNHFGWRITEGHKIMDKDTYKSYRIAIDAFTGQIIDRWDVNVKKYDSTDKN